jgi:uncharacterized protein
MPKVIPVDVWTTKERTPVDKRSTRDLDFIETFGGKRVYFMEPQPDDFDINDIAHALANNCRWTGHCRFFMSVAEHSVAVSYLCDDPLAGLLHDASEAYLTDVAKPIKPFLENYMAIEDKIMRAIAAKFKFNYPLASSVKAADNQQLSTEAHHLVPSQGDHWSWDRWSVGGKRPAVENGIAPVGLTPIQAERVFLNRYKELTA